MSYVDNDYPALATHVGHGHFLVACNACWSGTQEGRIDKICDTWTPALPYALQGTPIHVVLMTTLGADDNTWNADDKICS